MKTKFVIKAFVVIVTVFIMTSVAFIPNATSTTPTLYGRSVDIYFNDRLAIWGDALPFVQSEPPYRTMVPIRFFSESIGAQVSWDEVNKEVTVAIDATLTYDHMARQVKLKVGSDQAKVIVGNDEKIVVLDTSIWQESEYPWRTFAPLRFVSEGLAGKVTWGGVGGESNIFPDQILEQDEVCIIYFFPVQEEDYLIVPGERYGKYELRWSLAQLKDELNLRMTYEGEGQQNWHAVDENKPDVCIEFGKGVFFIGQAYKESSSYQTTEGLSLGGKITSNTYIGGNAPVVQEVQSASRELMGYTLVYPGFKIWTTPGWLIYTIGVASPWYTSPIPAN